jgi:hypothetical protein
MTAITRLLVLLRQRVSQSQFPDAGRYARDRGFDVNGVAEGKGCYQQSSRPNIVRCPDGEDRGFAAGPISGGTGTFSEP